MACQVIFDDITLTTGRSCRDSIHKRHNGSQICSLSLCSAFWISQECRVDVSKPDLTKKDVKTCCPDEGISKFLNLNFFIKTLDPQNGPSLNCKPVGQVTPDAGDLYGWQHVTSPLDAGILSVCEEQNGRMRGKVLHGGMRLALRKRGAKKWGVGLVPPDGSKIKLRQNGLWVCQTSINIDPSQIWNGVMA